jgi:phosphotriesterase-related protein
MTLGKGSIMYIVQSVTGPIPSEELGITLVHEHVLSTIKSIGFSPLLDYKRSNGSCLVDVTPIGSPLERSAAELRKLSEETGIYIIASTGFYKEPYLPKFLFKMGVSAIADLFIKDITEGMENKGIKAGIIGEVGSSYNQITRQEEKILRAAARAQRRTGVPLVTHTTHGTMGLAQLEILEEEGADLDRVVIGHCDLNSDLDYHLSIARRGAYLGYDTIGKQCWLSAVRGEKFAYQKDDSRIHLILEVLDKGFGDRIVISSDIIVDELKFNQKTLGKFKYNYLLDIFLPKLREKGVNKQEIDLIIKENPKHLLTVRQEG